MKTIDACGISCPEPLLMLKKALGTENEVVLLVDSKNALNNCEDYARKKGYSVSTVTEEDRYKIQISLTK